MSEVMDWKAEAEADEKRRQDDQDARTVAINMQIHGAQLAAARLDQDEATRKNIEYEQKCFDRNSAASDERDRRMLWLETVAFSQLPLDEAVERAEAALAAYDKRWPLARAAKAATPE